MKPLLTIVAIIFLTACSKSPESVAKNYWQGILENDEELVELSTSSHSKRELFTSISPERGSKVSFGETEVDENQAQIATTLSWFDSEKDSATDFELLTILVQEESGWKVDTGKTRQQFFTAVYRTSLDGLSSVLAESLSSFQVLGEEVAGTMAQDISKAIEDMQSQSSEANEDIQAFLKALDEDFQQAIESLNSESN